MMAAVLLPVKLSFCSGSAQNSFLSYVDHYEKYLVTGNCWGANHSPKHCALFDCRHFIVLIIDNGMKQLFNKLKMIQFAIQLVECFHTMFILRFNDRVCTKKGQLPDFMEKALNFTQHFRKLKV